MQPDQNPCLSAEDIVVLGKIVEPYGLRGAVKIHPFADDASGWAKLRQWYLGEDPDAPASWRCKRLLSCKVHADMLVAQFEDVTDRTAAEAIDGLLVGVPKAELPPAGKDEYYWADLIGLEVRNSRDESLGRVVGLIETSANDVLRVTDGSEKERLLPFVAAIVRDVDIANRRILVDWEADW